MEALFKWSKVYTMTHEQGNYYIFTATHGPARHAGVMLPAAMDDIWNMAGSRLMASIATEQRPATTHEEVLLRVSSWATRNLIGKFVIAPKEGMWPPAEMDEF